MKIFSLFITALFLAIGTFGQGQLEIRKAEIILKNLKADDQPHTEVFQLKNTGDQPIIVTRVTPMTSVFKADWSREPIAPGKTGEVRLTFIPTQMQDNFDCKTLIYSNAKNMRAELTISGNIVDNPDKPELLYKFDMDGLKFKTGSVNFNDVYTWKIISDTVSFINTRQEAVSLSTQYQPAHIQTRFIPEKVEAGKKGVMILTYDAPKKNDFGYHYESLILSVNGSRDYKNRLNVTANLVEDFSKLSKKEIANAPVASFDKKEINFGDINKGGKANCDFVLTNTGKSTLFVRKTKASCGCTAVTMGENAIEPGKSTTIRATFDSTGKDGRQYKSITVITNDPVNRETILTINGNIKS